MERQNVSSVPVLFVVADGNSNEKQFHRKGKQETWSCTTAFLIRSKIKANSQQNTQPTCRQTDDKNTFINLRGSEKLLSNNIKIKLYIYIYILRRTQLSSPSSVICQTTGPKPLLKRFLHIVRSRASSFNCQYPLLSLRSSSFLRFLRRLLTTILCCIYLNTGVGVCVTVHHW